MSQVHIIDHPLVQHKLTLMRDENTSPREFRELVSEAGMLMAYEVMRDLPTREVEVDTPEGRGTFTDLASTDITLVPILRAGLGMEAGVLAVAPFARIGHIGVYRVEEKDGSIGYVQYYRKMPQGVEKSTVIVVDPMLATGGSAIGVLDILKDLGCDKLQFMCLIAAPEGVAALQKAHPDVDIYVAAIDERLNEHSYIVPGLGDAGDRIFGTL